MEHVQEIGVGMPPGLTDDDGKWQRAARAARALRSTPKNSARWESVCKLALTRRDRRRRLSTGQSSRSAAIGDHLSKCAFTAKLAARKGMRRPGAAKLLAWAT